MTNNNPYRDLTLDELLAGIAANEQWILEGGIPMYRYERHNGYTVRKLSKVFPPERLRFHIAMMQECVAEIRAKTDQSTQ
jgi:hypothetical protein